MRTVVLEATGMAGPRALGRLVVEVRPLWRTIVLDEPCDFGRLL